MSDDYYLDHPRRCRMPGRYELAMWLLLMFALGIAGCMLGK